MRFYNLETLYDDAGREKETRSIAEGRTTSTRRAHDPQGRVAWEQSPLQASGGSPSVGPVRGDGLKKIAMTRLPPRPERSE